MAEIKPMKQLLHDLAFRYGVRPPKLKIVNLSRRFYNLFGFSSKTTSLMIHGYFDYKTKTILLHKESAKDWQTTLPHEFNHYLQYLEHPKEFKKWAEQSRTLAKKRNIKRWLKFHENSQFEKTA